jgi:hypothetical protein
VEGLLEHARHQRRLAHGDGPLGDRLGDRLDIDGLEVFLVDAGARRLAGNAKNWYGIGLSRVQAGDHVGAGRTGGTDTHAEVAGLGAGVAFGHVRGALDVARQDVADAVAFTQCRIQRVNRGARHPERDAHALFFHHVDCCFSRGHLCHVILLVNFE